LAGKYFGDFGGALLKGIEKRSQKLTDFGRNSLFANTHGNNALVFNNALKD
jgi:hypothetical protein